MSKTQRMSNVPQMYVSVCGRIHEQTLTYVDAIRCSVTALVARVTIEVSKLSPCIEFRQAMSTSSVQDDLI